MSRTETFIRNSLLSATLASLPTPLVKRAESLSAQNDRRAGEPPGGVSFSISYKELRACADRSWSARRSTLPTIPTPCLPDQSPNDDDHLREGHPEIYHPPHPLRAPHEFLVGVVPRTRPLHHPPIASPERCRLAFLGDLGK